MKMLTVEHTHEAKGTLASRSLGISGKAAAKIIYQILTGQVSDKVAYPIREYSTNAWEVSPDNKPFELDLPTRFNPRIRFRDFGPGLSHTFMMGRYGVIGDSTKDKDDKAVGGWGNGSKSALAYLIREDGAGSFTVRSYYRGVVSTYSIGLSTQGGVQIECLDRSPTGEPSGLEVSFPVRSEDITAFHEKAKEILWSFHPWPVIKPALGWAMPAVAAHGPGWTLYDPATVPWEGPHVRMGPVMYPVDLNEIAADTSFLNPSDCILFDAEIGSLRVTSSRERLSYEDRTRATLARLVEGYEASFIADLQRKLDACTTYWEAINAFYDSTTSLGLGRANRVRRQLNWRLGELLDQFPERCMRLSRGWFSFDKFDGSSSHTTRDAKGFTIVVDHSADRSLERFQALGLIGQPVLWFRLKKRDLPAFLQRYGLTREGIHVLNDVQLQPLAPGERVKKLKSRRMLSLGSNVHIEAKPVDLEAGGLFIRTYSHGYRRRRRSETSVWVKSNLARSIYDLERLHQRLQALHIDVDDILILKPDEDLPNENWFWLGDFLELRLNDLLDLNQVSSLSEKNTGSMSTDLRRIAPVQIRHRASGPEGVRRRRRRSLQPTVSGWSHDRKRPRLRGPEAARGHPSDHDIRLSDRKNGEAPQRHRESPPDPRTHLGQALLVVQHR